MIICLKTNDKVTFYEIYQTLDSLNIFDTQWQKDVSKQLSDVSRGLSSLMSSVDNLNRSITKELKTLTYTTNENFKTLNTSISNELRN